MLSNDTVKIEQQGNVIVAYLLCEKILDDETIVEIEESISASVKSAQAINLILDFTAVKFLTSSFLGYLIRLSKIVDESKGQLRLCGIEDKIQGIFKITRLDKIFDIHADIDKAILSLGQK